MMNNRIDEILDIINNDIRRKDWKKLFLRLTKEFPHISVVRRLGAIYEFKKFLVLKVIEKDMNATLLSPSYLVDIVWHQALIDNRFYNTMCQDLFPNTINIKEFMIYHDPAGGENADERQQRYKNTLKGLRQHFQEKPDDLIWNDEIFPSKRSRDEIGDKTTDADDDDDDNEQPPMKRSKTPDVPPAPLGITILRARLVDKQKPLMTLVLDDVSDNTTTHIVVNGSTEWSEIVDLYEKYKNLPSNYSKTFKKKDYKLSSSSTVSDIGLVNNDVIIAKNNTCISITLNESTGQYMIFKIKKNTQIETVMNAYAKRRSIDVSDFSFFLDGQRLNNRGTPITLEISDGDKIDVMPKQEGC